jgi:hypothetical protein
MSSGKTVTKELHVYAGASEKAIAAVAYLRTLDKDGNPDLGFVLGKAKVAHPCLHNSIVLED